MFDVGWSELLIIGVVALIVVGPEDLPRMFHSLGRMTAKARAMAREFSSAMEDAARQSGVKDAADSLNDVRRLTNRKALGLDALDRAADRFEKWDPKLPTSRNSILPDPAQPAPAPEAARPDGAVPRPPAPAPANTPSPAAAAAPAPSLASPASAEAPAHDAPEHGAPAPGRRVLKAVRRSDLG